MIFSSYILHILHIWNVLKCQRNGKRLKKEKYHVDDSIYQDSDCYQLEIISE